MVEPIVKRAGGLDVHKKSVVASIVLEQADGTLHQETRSFGTCGRQRPKRRGSRPTSSMLAM